MLIFGRWVLLGQSKIPKKFLIHGSSSLSLKTTFWSLSFFFFFSAVLDIGGWVT